jgi:hypothetical protein
MVEKMVAVTPMPEFLKFVTLGKNEIKNFDIYM